jgi:hypothetical protein
MIFVLLDFSNGRNLCRFIETGIGYYVGFGTSGGAAAIYPLGKPMGATRRLGINELLAHHHMTKSLIVQCR